MQVLRHPATRRGLTAFAALALLSLALVPSTLAAGPTTITFASDPSWMADDADPSVGPALTLPAPAQLVCLNASAPTGCPAGATLYGWAGGGWSADLSGLPGAWWIWAPGIDSSTSPADLDAYTFAKTITVPGTPTAGSISFGADDRVEVFVNGTSAGTHGSPDSLKTVDIGSHLVEGDNTIVVRAANALICQSDCPYQRNPAGVVFGGSITYEPAPSPSPDPSAEPSPSPSPSPSGGVGELTPPPTETLAEGSGEGGSPLLPALLVLLATGLLASTARWSPLRRR